MNLPSLPLTNGALFWDNTSIEDLNNCARASEYRKLHKRISIAEAPALNFGSAIHLGAELRYKTCGTSPTDPLYDLALSQVLHHFWEAHPTPMEEYRNLNWSMEILRRYNNKFHQEEFDLLQFDSSKPCGHCNSSGEIWEDFDCPFCSGTGSTRAMVELSFAVKLFDYTNKFDQTLPSTIPIYFSGRIDLPILRDKKDFFILDHKTTSMFGPTTFDAFKMSAQLKGYCWAFEQATGQKCRGYGVNAIRVSEPPKYVTEGGSFRGKSKSPEQWWDESLQREWYLLNPGELDEWKTNIIIQIEKFFWHYSKQHFSKDTVMCVGKYGRCPYFEVCSLYPETDRGAFLSSGLFKDDVWTPLISPTSSRM